MNVGNARGARAQLVGIGCRGISCYRSRMSKEEHVGNLGFYSMRSGFGWLKISRRVALNSKP